MKKIFRVLPLIVVLGFILFKTITNWKNYNGLLFGGFLFEFVIIIYVIFVSLTAKYIDFKDRLKIKTIEIAKEKANLGKMNYLFNSLYIVCLILFFVYFYYSIFEDMHLQYLLSLSIGIAALSLILRTIIENRSKFNDKR